MMSEHHVLNAVLSVMSPEELHYVIAYCDNQCRCLSGDTWAMEKWDRRMQKARAELENRRNR